MATKATTKVKAAAQKYTCQSKDEVMRDIKNIGDLRREHIRITTQMNDAIAAINQENAPELKRLDEEIKRLQGGVQTFCEANRESLCGKGKTANLITGEVAWRARPPSVKVTGVEAVLGWLKNMGMHSFVRSKEEINKEAMLNEPEKAKAVPGIKIETGVEDFLITPFEVDPS